MSFLLIGAVGAALILFLFYYHRRYVERMNQALVQESVKWMPETRLMLLFLLSAMTLLVVFYNLVPVLKEPNLDLREVVQTDAVTQSTKIHDPSYFAYVDQKQVEGGTVAAYSNDQFYCYGLLGATCQSYQHSASQISYYNDAGVEIWNLGGYLASQIDIHYEDIQFDARAVDRLTDGRFVAFGNYVDLTTEVFGIGLLLIASDGTILDMTAIDLAAYEMTRYGGHRYFELIAAEDGGFVLQYKELFDGSFVAKFDSLIQEEWHHTVSEPLEGGIYSGLHVGEYAETLIHEDGWTYVLNNDEIRSIDPTGTPQWSYTFYGHEYSGFRYHDGFLYALSRQTHVVLKGKTLFELSGARNGMTELNVELLDPQEGSLVKRATFLYDDFHMDLQSVSLSPRDVLVDEMGNMTLLAVDTASRHTFSYQSLFFLIQFDAEGTCMGLAVLEDTFVRSSDVHRWDDSFQKAYYRLEDGNLVLDAPTLSVNRLVDLTNLAFDTEFEHDFDISFYENTLQLRVAFNQTIVTLWGLFFVAMVLFRIRDEVRRERSQQQDDLPREWPHRSDEE